MRRMNIKQISAELCSKKAIRVETLVHRICHERPNTTPVEAKIAILSAIAEGYLQLDDHWRVRRAVLRAKRQHP
jgi:hypothetical protein